MEGVFTADGARVLRWSRGGGADQRWRLRVAG
ncbi:hypothetical protein NCC78_26600 [Micromonospora phytophila]|nr:hypothetical protein [Micromonospora phytophila]